jgi:hypothetical protein
MRAKKGAKMHESTMKNEKREKEIDREKCSKINEDRRNQSILSGNFLWGNLT